MCGQVDMKCFSFSQCATGSVVLLAFSCKEVRSIGSGVQENVTSPPGFWKAGSKEARGTVKSQKALGLHFSCLQCRCTLKYEPFWYLLAWLCTSLPIHWWGTFFLSCKVPRAAIQCSTLFESPRRDASVSNICYLLSLPHLMHLTSLNRKKSPSAGIRKKLIVWFPDKCLGKETASQF